MLEFFYDSSRKIYDLKVFLVVSFNSCSVFVILYKQSFSFLYTKYFFLAESFLFEAAIDFSVPHLSPGVRLVKLALNLFFFFCCFVVPFCELVMITFN